MLRRKKIPAGKQVLVLGKYGKRVVCDASTPPSTTLEAVLRSYQPSLPCRTWKALPSSAMELQSSLCTSTTGINSGNIITTSPAREEHKLRSRTNARNQ